MQLHASCAARRGHGVLLLGPAGSGKSDLLLRLIHDGFELVADDRVDIDATVASAPDRLAGLLEVRGLGLLRLPYCAAVPLRLAVQLGRGERLPHPAAHPDLPIPLVLIDPAACSAPIRVARALDCALGHTEQVAGAFA